MALSGTINGSTANKYIDSKITWSAIQSIDGNYSNVTATLYYSRNNTGYTTSGTWSGSITINGTKINGASQYLKITHNSNTVAMTCTVKVPHNSDGTKTITISAAGTIPETTLSSINISKSVTLDTIPRASSVTLSASSVNVGASITATISRYSSSFTHQVKFFISGKESTYYKTFTGVGTSQSFTIPDTWYAAMPSSSSCTAYCRVTTLNNGVNVGDAVSKSFTVNVPSSVKPTIGSITLTPTPITLTNGKRVDLLVKGKNKITVKASGCSAGNGSTIAYYTFQGPSLNNTVVVDGATECSYTGGTVGDTGTQTYKVTVGDGRGSTRAVTQSKTIVCHDYYNPSISNFKASRIANQDGTSSIKCTYTPNYALVNGTNGYTVTATYFKGTNIQAQPLTGSGDTIPLGQDTDSVYQIYLTITDYYGGSGKSDVGTVYGTLRTMNITQDGTGVAIGKLAESNELFECRWPAQFDHNVDVQNNLNVQNDLEVDGIIQSAGISDTGGIITIGSIVTQYDVSFGAIGHQGRLYSDYNTDHDNIVYLRTGTNTTGGKEAGIAIHETSVYVPDVENSGIVNLGSSGRRWNQLYAKSGTIETSDENQKNNIEDMSDVQANLFSKLKPITYQMSTGTSGRTHYGFGSREVEKALLELGMTGQDFAGFCKDAQIDENGQSIVDEDGNIVYDYALRYSEFIALNTYMIQKLQQIIQDQQEEINDMKAEIDKLKNTSL